MHFYITSYVSRQILLFLHITAFFSFRYDSALSIVSSNFLFLFFFFFFCGSVSVFQGALLNYYCSPKDILVIYVMNLALKRTHLNLLL